jgi:hypothetical protein
LRLRFVEGAAHGAVLCGADEVVLIPPRRGGNLDAVDDDSDLDRQQWSVLQQRQDIALDAAQSLALQLAR